MLVNRLSSSGGFCCYARWLIAIAIIAVFQLSAPLTTHALAQPAEGQSSEEALAIYADAANFQNNGAYDLAIEQWRKFLDQFPNDPLASKAAHYLGNALMQRPEPDHLAAADAYKQALQDKEFELREEALVNRGWSLHAAGQSGGNAELHREALDAFEQLLKEYPRSKLLSQTLFYAGEAAYAASELTKAIYYYDTLLKRDDASAEPLQCQALYAKGVAWEEAKETANALQTFDQFLSDCKDSPLFGEVALRKGDLLADQGQWDQADAAFQQAYAAGGDLADYALYRRAYALSQSNQTEQAAEVYRKLGEEFPQSQYATIARLSAAQAFYRAGQDDQAEAAFRALLEDADGEVRMEAVHWLSQIALRRGEPGKVIELARPVLDDVAAAPYRSAVQIDLAEALAANPETRGDAIDLFLEASEAADDPDVAARALYNAAFTALQLGDTARTIELAQQFLGRFPQDILAGDVRYVEAEAHLQQQDYELAADKYDALLKDTEPDNPSRALWQLRAARAEYLAGRYESLTRRMREAVPQMQTEQMKSEAEFLLGAGLLLGGASEEAIPHLEASLGESVPPSQAADALLLLGRAHLATGASDAAIASWKRLVETYPQSRAAEEAQFRLAQQYAEAGQYDAAQQAYQAVIDSGIDPQLVPLAWYGIGWARLQQKDFAGAIDALNSALAHPEGQATRADALLARGMAFRRSDRAAEARQDFEAFLDEEPEGKKLADGLYELALLASEQGQLDQAVAYLRQVVDQVPDYEALDQVRYELAWALKESDQPQAAAEQFARLAEQFPDSPLRAEARFYQAQQLYDARKWEEAEGIFREAAEALPQQNELRPRALYRLGWTQFQQRDFAEARESFQRLLSDYPDGALRVDAHLMVAETYFQADEFQPAIAAYEQAREAIDAAGPLPPDTAGSQQRIRELVMLHGAQSLSQLERYEEAIEWLDALRSKYPSTVYLAQVFYELGYAYHQQGDPERALHHYAEVAGNYRSEIAARARFMIGEIHFSARDFAKAIPEFQRVMYGFGAEDAPDNIKTWQAKSGFEAGRCAELLISSARADRRSAAIRAAKEFYQYVVEKHPGDPLAAKARQRLSVVENL